MRTSEGVTIAGLNWSMSRRLTEVRQTDKRRRMARAQRSPTRALGQHARGWVVCKCFDVSESEIVSASNDGEGLDALHARTQCGTNCGSCFPALQRMVQAPKAGLQPVNQLPNRQAG